MGSWESAYMDKDLLTVGSVHSTEVLASRTRRFFPGYRVAIGGKSLRGGPTQVLEESFSFQNLGRADGGVGIAFLTSAGTGCKCCEMTKGRAGY